MKKTKGRMLVNPKAMTEEELKKLFMTLSTYTQQHFSEMIPAQERTRIAMMQRSIERERLNKSIRQFRKYLLRRRKARLPKKLSQKLEVKLKNE